MLCARLQAGGGFYAYEVVTNLLEDAGNKEK